jgi:multiple sugar transport system substrate-binding protein
MKRRTLLLGTLVGVPAAAGCTPGGQDASSSAGTTTGDPVRVTLISRTSEQEAFQKRTLAFKERYPKIALEYQPLTGDYGQAIRTNLAAGTLADAIYFENTLFDVAVGSGTVQPIDRLVQRDRIDLKQWYPSMIESQRVDGKLFGLPARGQLARCFLYYNRDAFSQAGVPEPTDQWALDDLVAAAEKLTVRDGSRFGYGTAWGEFQDTIAALRRFGADLLSTDGKRCVADTPQALAAMQWHHDLWHRRQVASTKVFAVPDFASGALAMGGGLLAGNRTNIRTAVQTNFRWSMVAMPKGPTGKFGAILSVAPIGLNKQSRAVDQAWEALKWFTDKETGLALAFQSTGSATPGARKDVYCDERMLADPAFPRDMMERVCKIMDQSSTVPYSFTWNYRQVEVTEVVGRHMHAFRENRAAPSAATMRALTSEVQAILDLPRGTG